MKAGEIEKRLEERLERGIGKLEEEIAHVEQVLEHELERPTVPRAAVLYGDVVYWGTILGSVVAILGSVLAFVSDLNYMRPEAVLSALWQGHSVDAIWSETVGSRPDGHWYLAHLGHGDGLTMAGIALGVFVVVPGMLVSAWLLLRQRQRLFAGFGLLASGITVAAMFA